MRAEAPSSFRAEVRRLRQLFAMAFLEVCSVGLITARLPILLTTEYARRHDPSVADGDGLALVGGRCRQGAAWAPPSPLDVASNSTATATACPLPASAAAPCCSAAGSLRFPDSCPPGVTALVAAPRGSNWHYPHASSCAAGNTAAVTAASTSDAAVLLLTFVSSPVAGQVSDAFGRRHVLLAAQLLQLLPALALFGWAYADASITLFFVARALTGAVNSIACALAYVADLTSAQNRAPAFGLLLATASLGVVAAPIGAAMDGRTLAAASLIGHLITVVFTAVALPESLPVAQRTPFSKAALSPVEGLSITVRSRRASQLTAVLCLSGLANRGLQDITSFFLQAGFGFDSVMLARLLLLLGAVLLLLQGLALKPLVARLGEAGVLLLACAACTAYDYALAAAAAASAGAWVAFAICGSLAMLGTLIFPSLSALMSQAADEKEQGNIQGALHAAQALAQAAGLLCFPRIYSRWGGEATFAVGGAVNAAAAALAAGVWWQSRGGASRRGAGGEGQALIEMDDTHSAGPV